jgi:hypothetical protein
MMTRCICDEDFAMSKSGRLFSGNRFWPNGIGFWSIRFWPLQQVILSLFLAHIMTSTCVAQPAAAVPRFWGLRQGDKMVFTVAGSRRTDIVVDGQPEMTQETSESSQVQLTSVDFDRNGDVIFRVEVQQIDRKPPIADRAKINVHQVFLRVQPDGKASTLSPEIREILVATLADGNPETINIMKKCLTDESIASWFSVPFWSPGPAEDPQKQAAWERTHEVSLGTLGTLQMDLRFMRSDIEKNMLKVAVTGESRFRPLVLPDADTAMFPFFSNVSVEIDEISGTATLPQPATKEDVRQQQKFGFDSVEWTLKLHGKAELTDVSPSKSDKASPPGNDDSGEAKADANVGKVTFRQTQHHVWKLQSFESSSRRIFENDQFRTPVPVR